MTTRRGFFHSLATFAVAPALPRAAIAPLARPPQLGWSIGSALGASLGPIQRVYGPRLSELRVTKSRG